MVCKSQRPCEADLENMIPHPLSIQTCRLIPQGTKCVNKEMSEDEAEVPGAEAQSRAAIAVVVRQRERQGRTRSGAPSQGWPPPAVDTIVSPRDHGLWLDGDGKDWSLSSRRFQITSKIPHPRPCSRSFFPQTSM